MERMLTIHATLRRQHRHILDFMRASCLAARRNHPGPSILPIEASVSPLRRVGVNGYDPGPPRMAGRAGSSPDARPGRRRVRTGRRVERRRVGGRAGAGVGEEDARPRCGKGGVERAGPRRVCKESNWYRATSPSGGQYHLDIMMKSGEPLAGRRSEFMSTSRESHRVASRTLDLERRLRVPSATASLPRSPPWPERRPTPRRSSTSPSPEARQSRHPRAIGFFQQRALGEPSARAEAID